MALIPRDEKYFADFDKQAAIVVKMVGTMKTAVDKGQIPENLWEPMKKLENEADAVVRDILTRVEKSFVTPIEREDIHLLAVTIDDMADAVDAAASRMNVFAITEPTPELKDIVHALAEMAEHIQKAVKALRTMKPVVVTEATAHIDALEKKVDGLYRNALRTLFARKPEAYELVRWKEIYDILEAAADHGRHVARSVNHIVVRHA